MKREELIKSLKWMYENIMQLPQEALLKPINHYDLASLIQLIYEILKKEENNE